MKILSKKKFEKELVKTNATKIYQSGKYVGYRMKTYHGKGKYAPRFFVKLANGYQRVAQKGLPNKERSRALQAVKSIRRGGKEEEEKEIPSAKTLFVPFAERKLGKCDEDVEKILSVICAQALNKLDAYEDFAPYREAFIAYMIAHETDACFQGRVYVICSRKSKGVEPDWAEVSTSPDFTTFNPTVCGDEEDSKRRIINVSIRFGPFTKEGKQDGWKSEYWKLDDENKFNGGHANFCYAYYVGKDHPVWGHDPGWIIDHIEPNGYANWNEKVDAALRNYFKTVDEYKAASYSKAEYSCPRFGVQYTTQDALCANWSMLLAFLQLRCPEVDARALQSQLVSKGRSYLEKLMKHWTCFIWQYSVENNIVHTIIVYRKAQREATPARLRRWIDGHSYDKPEELILKGDIEGLKGLLVSEGYEADFPVA